MLFKRNMLESVTVAACGGTIVSVLIHYLTYISPFSGIWFPLYSLLVFGASVFFSFKLIQWSIRLNKPVKCDLEGLIKQYTCLSGLKDYVPKKRDPMNYSEDDAKDYDTNELSVISTVLERKLVSSWYIPYISQEIGFPFACKQMLDQMIGKTFQVCNKIETKDVFVDICSILVSHLKEYKKAVKRHQKSPESSVESLYKMSHLNSDERSIDCPEYCVKMLRIILKELVPWELWETPHSELIIRILSKKLVDFIDNTIADPLWLNDKLLTLLKVDTTKLEIKPEVKENLKDVTNFCKPEDISNDIVLNSEPTIETALSTMIMHSTAPILQNAEVDGSDEVVNPAIPEELTSDTMEIKMSPVLRQRRGRQGRNEVKIYDRVIEGSVKTWETDVDLQCCSLGQDLLASLDGEITLSRLWGQEADGDQNNQMWFGEEENLDLETNPSPKETSPVKKELSPKPAELLKDLQTTVHQAKTKIGDLQVTKNFDVPRNRSSDEAAGMMEGLLDFGIAGLKKGLRLTGLSDDSDKSPSHQPKDKQDISPSLETVKVKSYQEPMEPNVTTSLLQREDNGLTPVHPLVKQQRVTSQDSVPSQPIHIGQSESIPLATVSDSPEPEYEEVADLSTSIAKLRSLLQQRADNSPNGMGDIWWEGAEETRGRTTLNTRHIDPASLADEYDMNTDRGSSPNQASNNMQRLDKLFHRTVTGVFNSIKTAVGAEGDERGEVVTSQYKHDWTYVCTSVELSVIGAVARLVGARRARAHVDAALDTLAERTHTQRAHVPPVPDDFEDYVWYQYPLWSSIAEVLVSADLITAHVTYRLATLLLADLAESLTSGWLDELSKWLREQIFVVFSQMSDESHVKVTDDKVVRELDLDETVSAVIGKVPELQLIFGEETLTSAVKLSISSLLHKEINKDLTFRIIDTFALHFKKSAGLRNPSFDAN